MADVAALKGKATFDASQALTGIGGLIGRVGSLKTALIGAGVALAAIATKEAIDLIKKGVEAYKIQEAAVNRLEASLATAGTTGLESLDLLIASAKELQKITTKGDEAIIAATADLRLLAKELGPQELADAQKALIGIADVFLKGDLVNAASLLGKSIGSTTNALTRYGIAVDTTATQSEKLASILKQSNAFFEVSKAQVFTLAGAQQQLNNAWGDSLELIGDIFVRITQAEGAYRGLTAVVNDFTDFLEDNRDEIVRWGRVVITVMSESLETTVRLFLVLKALGNLNIQSLLFRGGDAIDDIRAGVAALGDQVTIGLRIVAAFEEGVIATDAGSAAIAEFKDRLSELSDVSLTAIQEGLAANLLKGVEDGLANIDLNVMRQKLLAVSREIFQRGEGGPIIDVDVDTSKLADALRDVPVLGAEVRRIRQELAEMAGPMDVIGTAIVEAVGATEDWRERVVELARIWSDDAAKAVQRVVDEQGLLLEPVEQVGDVVGALFDQWQRAADAAEDHRREVERTVRAVETLSRGFIDVLQATGLIDRDLGSILGSSISVGSSIQGIVGSRKTDPVTGLPAGFDLVGALPFFGGALGAGANILSGIIGGGGETTEERLLREGLNELRIVQLDLAGATRELSKAFGGFSGDVIQGLLKLPGLGPATIGDNQVSIPLTAERLRDEFGLSIADLESAARAAGVPIEALIQSLLGNVDSIEEAKLAAEQWNTLIEILPEATLAMIDFNSSISDLAIEFALFDLDKPLEQIPRLLEELFKFTDLPADLEEALTGADLSTAEGRAAFKEALQEAFLSVPELVKGGALDKLTPTEFKQFLGRLDGIADKIEDGTTADGAAIGGFRVDRTITLAEASRQTAFLSSITVLLSQILRVEQAALTLAGGTVPEDTIDLSPAFSTGSNVFTDSLAVLTDIRSILRAGLGNPITGAPPPAVVVNVQSPGSGGPIDDRQITSIDRGLGQRGRRTEFFTGAPRTTVQLQ